MVVTVVRRMVEKVCRRFEHRHHRFEVERFAFWWAAVPRCEVGSSFDLTARAVGVDDGDPFAHFDFTDELEPCVFGEHSETVLGEGWYDDEVTCFDVHVGAIDVETDRSAQHLEDLVAAVAVQTGAGAGRKEAGVGLADPDTSRTVLLTNLDQLPTGGVSTNKRHRHVLQAFASSPILPAPRVTASLPIGSSRAQHR